MDIPAPDPFALDPSPLFPGPSVLYKISFFFLSRPFFPPISEIFRGMRGYQGSGDVYVNSLLHT